MDNRRTLASVCCCIGVVTPLNTNVPPTIRPWLSAVAVGRLSNDVI